MAMFQICNLSFGYEENITILNDIDISADAGEIIAVCGSSGAGKTTLLKIICNVIPQLIPGFITGEIKLDGKNISNLTLPEMAPKISLLLQEPENQLFFPTVENELAFGPENLCLPKEEIFQRIDYALQLLNIENLRYQETAHLSFGQKKLVALASLITLSPRIFLLDEPGAGLSEHYLNIIKEAISKLSTEGKIFLIADHIPALLNMSSQQIIIGKS